MAAPAIKSAPVQRQSISHSMQQAAVHGTEEVIRKLIENSECLTATDESGNTPLHMAAENNQVAIMQILIDAKAGLEARNKDQQTPLLIAASAQAKAAAEWLIKQKADVNAQDKWGFTACDLNEEPSIAIFD